jgi:hypothetical protein
MAARMRWFELALRGDGVAERVATSAAHLGDAIAIAQARLRGATALAARALPADAVPLGESIGKGVVQLGSVGVDLPPPPHGLLHALPAPSPTAAPPTAPMPTPGWRHVAAPGGELAVVLEAQAPGPAAIEAFLSVAERQPTLDNLEVRVLPHADAGGGLQAAEVWLSPRATIKDILRLLDDNDRDLLHSGHVELSLYLRRERSTLRLTEHKSLVWLSADAASAGRIVDALAACELRQSAALRTWAEVPHVHYRPAGSRDLDGLRRRLRGMKLRELRAAPASAPRA